MKKFNPSSNHPDRALQAWQILVGKAMNRQTITYKGLSQLMYKKDAAGVLDKILGHVAFFCSDNKLHALTSIVVGKGRGTPGRGIPVDPKLMDRKREKVYDYDWYNVYPPTPTQLAESFVDNI
jgi:hypothetical protein